MCLIENVTAQLTIDANGLKAFGFSENYSEKILLPYILSFVMIIVTSEPIVFLVFSRQFSAS